MGSDGQRPGEEGGAWSETFLRSLLQHALDVVTILAPDGTRRYVSPAIERVLGYPPEALIGTDPFTLVHPDDADRVRGLFTEIMAMPGRQHAATEFRAQHRDGSWRWLEAVGTNLLADPDIAGVVVNSRDITERKAAEEALRASEARFATVFQTSPVAIVVRSLVDGRFRDVNDSFLEMTGYTREEVIGCTPSDLGLWAGSPEDDAVHVAGRVQAHGRVRNHEGTFRAKDGYLRQVLLSLERIELDGEACLLGVGYDITERKAAEAALRTSEQRARDLAAEAQRQARELALLDRVRTAVAREVDPAVVTRTVVEAIAAAFGYTQVSLYLREGNSLILQHQVGYTQVLPRIPLSQGVMGRVARSGEPVLLSDVREDPTFLGAIAGIVSEVCVPVREGDGVVGVLNVESTDGVTLSEADLQLMLALADHVGIALGRARLEAARREDEARFRSLVQNASDVVAIVDLAGTWSYASPPIEQLLGHRPEELIGHPVEALVHPEDVLSVRRFWAEAVDDPAGTPVVEVRLRHRDGSWPCFELRGTNRLADSSTSGIVVNGRDITERKILEEQLIRSALTDALTELPNRALFLDRLSQALARAEQDGHEVAVLFLDLDHFKVVNDSLGHEAGDRALVAVGKRLAAALRPGDTVARFGGDEFMVLLEGCSATTAVDVAQRLLAALGSPLHVDGHDAIVSASIGISVRTPALHVAADLLRAADTALYRAKAAGRNTAVVFAAEMYADALARLDWEINLRAAVEQGHLCLDYQPEVELSTGQVVSFEALVRWDHPEAGAIPPEDFIPVAEETGLIVRLGAWVLTEACRQACAWPVPPGAEAAPGVSVNVSARQVRHPDFVAHVRHALQQTGLAANRLTLEVTERVFVEDAVATGETLREVTALGVGLAIDDFGTGYSSLGYLRRLPVDRLKIDRVFLSGTGSTTEDRAIVAALAALGRALGLGVTAEGVETAEQLAYARSVGCDRAQGYHLRRPLDPAALRALLADPRLFEANVG